MNPTFCYSSLSVSHSHNLTYNFSSMDIQRGPLLSLAYFCQGRSMEELRQSLLYTTLELEQTRITVGEELKKRDDQLIQLKTLLSKAMRERDEAQEKCQALFLEKLVFHQQQQQQVLGAPLSGVSSVDDEQQPGRGMDSNNGFSSSDCEESIVSSPVLELPPPPQQPTMLDLVPDRPLPEKGKLLQAVMKAGPLLQTLLLAGPLPQWRHPPPPLKSFEIPPVTISSAAPPLPPPLESFEIPHVTIPSVPPPPQLDSLISGCNNTLDNYGKVNRKRGLYEYDGSGSPTETKYQRLVLH